MSSQLRPKAEYKDLRCIEYELAVNRSILVTPEEEMPCDESTLSSHPEFEVTSDIKFREITR